MLLNGVWRLFGRKEQQPSTPAPMLENAEIAVDANVPGNLELALQDAGIVPDIFYADNAKRLRPYEFYEWVYVLEFDYNEAWRQPRLHFEGIDCLATVFLNGECVGKAENAFIAHSFDVGAALRKGKNTLAVHLASAANKLYDYPMRPSAAAFRLNNEIMWIRKPAHSFGWDIAPRICLGGLWRGVWLEEVPESRIEEFFIDTLNVSPEKATLRYSAKIATPELANQYHFLMKIEGRCGDSVFAKQFPVWSYICGENFTIDAPQIWNVRNYGAPNIYNVKASLCTFDGDVIATYETTLGIRTIELRRKELCTDGAEPDFQFFVNGKPVRLSGTNHVPVDALHSRDAQGYDALLGMVAELNCNVMRVWGGGVYEDDAFYDRCDKEGILIWQDFMMGCTAYPDDADLQARLEKEADVITRRLRQHPCIALWAGDNECDFFYLAHGLNPNIANPITRKVLPTVCRRNDPSRPYLPSSPYLSQEAYDLSIERNQYAMDFLPEQHLWGPRDNFKGDFYSNAKSSFSSEIGYHGCPSAASIRKFMPPETCEKMDVNGKNPMWQYRGSSPYLPDSPNYTYRVKLMCDQVREFFGECPDDLEQFAFASQIVQAEALKFFIERHRRSAKCTGVIWWNIKDCWPQTSDSIVDYYGVKKFAWHYVAVCQQPLLGMITDANAWHRKVIFTNDSAKDASGRFALVDALNNTTLLEGDFAVKAGEVREVANPFTLSGEKTVLLLRWECDNGAKGVNHILTGRPCYDLQMMREKMLPAIASAYGTFKIDEIGR